MSWVVPSKQSPSALVQGSVVERAELLLFREVHLSDIRVSVLQDAAGADDDSPVGMAVTHRVPGTASVMIDGVFIARDHRRRGAGRRLLATLADRCRAEGLNRLVARCDEPRMTEFLEGCGFRNSEDGLMMNL
jgi:GNAT superfamily N-acetyltransferase